MTFKPKETIMLVTLLPLSYLAYGVIYHLLILILISPLIYFGYTYVIHLREIKKFPPGPFPLPIIGNLHLIGAKPHEKLKEMGKTYGNVFSISLGMERTVVVNTIEPAREVLIKKGKIFAGRPNTYTAKLISRNGENMGFSDYGAYWLTLRKLGHTSFQLFAKDNKLEELSITESDFFHKRLRRTEGNAVDPTDDIGLTLINIICHICFGHRYEEDDDEFKQIIKFTGLIFSGLGSSDAVAVLPWLRIFPLEGLKKIHEGIAIRDPLFRRNVAKHEETFDPENIRDITDCMLNVRNNKEFLEKAELPNITNSQIEMIINDIFVGAIETTLATLRWSLVYLVRWPQYQDMMYDEIIKICGPNEYPTLKNKDSLPFVHACIQETQRVASLAPLGVPHKSMQDDTINGLPVPAGAQVAINHWACHYDEKHWENPTEFNPLRWIDENGNYFAGRNKSFIPFGAGRRNCFGEAIAKAELFILYSRLIKDFKIESDPDEMLPSLDGLLGITLSPHPFKVIFRSRRERKNSLVSETTERKKSLVYETTHDETILT